MKNFWGLCCIFAVLLGSQTFAADNSESLKPLLVDLSGWSAESAEGSSVNMGAVSLTTATRGYSKDAASLDLTLIVGSDAMIQGQGAVANFESAQASVKRTTIDGFDMIQSHDKENNTGAIIITISKNQAKGAMFIIGYENLTPEQAIELLKKFDLKNIKSAMEKLMQ